MNWYRGKESHKMDRKKKDLKPMLLKLKAVVDMRMLLAVFAVVLVVM